MEFLYKNKTVDLPIIHPDDLNNGKKAHMLFAKMKDVIDGHNDKIIVAQVMALISAGIDVTKNYPNDLNEKDKEKASIITSRINGNENEILNNIYELLVDNLFVSNFSSLEIDFYHSSVPFLDIAKEYWKKWSEVFTPSTLDLPETNPKKQENTI